MTNQILQAWAEMATEVRKNPTTPAEEILSTITLSLIKLLSEMHNEIYSVKLTLDSTTGTGLK